MVKCKKCKTEMDKVYVFGDKQPYQRWECPQCGGATAKRAIVYEDDGRLNEKKGGEVIHD